MKNKAYYYKKDVVKRSKMYGTTTYKLTVYGIKSGKLYRVGETEYNSGSTCGEWGEAWHLLRSAGLSSENPKHLIALVNIAEYGRHRRTAADHQPQLRLIY